MLTGQENVFFFLQKVFFSFRPQSIQRDVFLTYMVFFFDWSRPESVEAGKIPTKKVKVRVKLSHLAVGSSTFTFLVGILSSPTLRTFWAGPVKKNTL